MDDKTKIATRASITEKWQPLADGVPLGEIPYKGSLCPLCDAFPGHECTGCPINTATNGNGCHEWEPFAIWYREHSNENAQGVVNALQAFLDQAE